MWELLDQLFVAAVLAVPSMLAGAVTWSSKSTVLQLQGFGTAVGITWFLMHEFGFFRIGG